MLKNNKYNHLLTIAALLIISAGAAFCSPATNQKVPTSQAQTQTDITNKTTAPVNVQAQSSLTNVPIEKTTGLKTPVQPTDKTIQTGFSQTAQPAIPTTDQAPAENLGGSVIPVKSILIKFGIAMILVLASLVVIILGLNFMKKFFKQPSRITPKELYNDTLKTPKKIEEAIISFIKKNKL